MNIVKQLDDWISEGWSETKKIMIESTYLSFSAGDRKINIIVEHDDESDVFCVSYQTCGNDECSGHCGQFMASNVFEFLLHSMKCAGEEHKKAYDEIYAAVYPHLYYTTII